jgi:hypothetical protein
VRNNEAPKYARRAVDLESLAKIEETGKTVDLVPSPTMHYDESWKSPLVMKLVWGLVTAVICDVVLVILLFLLHK